MRHTHQRASAHASPTLEFVTLPNLCGSRAMPHSDNQAA